MWFFRFKPKDIASNGKVIYMIVDCVYSFIFDLRGKAIHVRSRFKIFVGDVKVSYRYT